MASVPHLGMPTNFFSYLLRRFVVVLMIRIKIFAINILDSVLGTSMIDFCSDNLYQKECCLSFSRPRHAFSFC